MNRLKKEEQKKTMRTITTTEPGVGSLSTTFIPWSISLDTLKPDVIISRPATPQKENTMYFHSHEIEDAAARNRLVDRTREAANKHHQKLRIKFHMDDHDVRQWSIKDAIKAINDSQFIYADEDQAGKKGSFYYNGLNIRWRDPSKPEDHDGFEKAIKTVSEETQAVIDRIAVLTPEKALEKVDKFREHTFN